jgi:hypothetical protein
VHILIAAARRLTKTEHLIWQSTIQQFPQGDVVSTSRSLVVFTWRDEEQGRYQSTRLPEQWYISSVAGIVKKE